MSPNATSVMYVDRLCGDKLYVDNYIWDKLWDNLHVIKVYVVDKLYVDKSERRKNGEIGM